MPPKMHVPVGLWSDLLPWSGGSRGCWGCVMDSVTVRWTASGLRTRTDSVGFADNPTGESLYLGHPKFEGFEVIQTERKSSAAA